MDRFFIGPMNLGIQTNMRPWAIQDGAYEQLENAYVFRGRVVKRFQLIGLNSTDFYTSRFRIDLGNTAAGTGNFGPFVCPGTVYGIGQFFTIGDTVLTVTSNAAGAVAMLSTGAATGTFDAATGTVTIMGNGENPSTPVYFYPSTPVMGLRRYEERSTNIDDPLIGFDTQFSYQWNTVTSPNAWEFLPGAVWTGADYQFFWTTTWRGLTNNSDILFVTNNNQPDGIRYWDGAAWGLLNPVYDNGGQTIDTCLLIIAFKDRLLFLNTTETVAGVPTTFYNRMRYSQNGSPFGVDAWNQDVPGKGSYLDADISEAIISAQFIKDRLIVFFERATYELVYTANDQSPFVWQKINRELGAEAPFSEVPFDKVVLGVGSTGIHACNGGNVDRIDDQIPQEIFNFSSDNNGRDRIYGVRDYFSELTYWSFIDLGKIGILGTANFPNRILLFNYSTNSWAHIDDTITAYGYYKNVNPFLESYQQVIGGNQQGHTFYIQPNVDNLGTTPIIIPITHSDPVLYLALMAAGVGDEVDLTVENHSFIVGEFIHIENCVGETGLNGNIYKIIDIPDINTITIEQAGIVPANYDGGGLIERVSKINILTKQYNFYADKGQDAYVERVEFMVDKTDAGAITVAYYPSSSTSDMVTDGTSTGAILGTSVLETSPYTLQPLEATQTRVWHPVYFQTEGNVFQMQLYWTDAQMLDNDISRLSDFQLHAMLFVAQPISNRLF
jgi:hypothetical protein